MRLVQIPSCSVICGRAAALLPALLLLGPAVLHAQGATAPAAPAAAASAPTQTIEVTATRQADAEQRRQSTAAKIVIGREEIDRFGDSTLGEVLKRLPGITLGSGPPGRGGGPRMRGLGAGYTQLLIDGQRVPPGFSLESLTPEQVERIEILRAPTAETGARAIGGTINIITREGFRRRLNDLRVGIAYEGGEWTPGLFWTHNDSAGDLTYTLSGSLFRNRRANVGDTVSTETDINSGTLQREQLETNASRETRSGLNFTSRLQWRLGAGSTLMLMPSVFHSQGDADRRWVLTQAVGSSAAEYATAEGAGDNRFTAARLNLQWRGLLGEGWRSELNGMLGNSEGRSSNRRLERAADGAEQRTVHDQSRTRDRSATFSGKVSRLLEGDHSLVSGFEVESLRRSEVRSSEQDEQDPLAEFEGDLQASSLRLALYAQDEWALNPNWAVHAGLRWESVRTRGDGSQAGAAAPDNRSSVWTPLLHAVWKPVPEARDQVRISLTRSYKSPSLQNLVARPWLTGRYPAGVANTANSPDRAGNPLLRPELATGIDVALERYLKDGGVLSVNLFHRRLKDYIRSTTELESVSWSPVQRYVNRPKNLGGAVTQGIELEAKFRLDQLVPGAPPVELRNNLSLFRSRVNQVPGPDNRLDEQPQATANVGADYRLRGTPLTLGGSLNLTPSYRTRLSEGQWREAGERRQFDAYALWVFNPAVQLRLLASNLGAADYHSTSAVEAAGLRTQAFMSTATETNWQLRLELKL